MITIATSIRYGNYKHLFNKAVGVERLIQKYWNDFRIKFDFDTRVKFLIRPIKGNTNGIAYDIDNRIEIDPRRERVQILETIAHELVHSEQTKQKRLSRTGRNRERVYHGQVYRTQVGNYTEYLNRPWEKEARERAAAFIQELSHNGTLALEK